MSLNELTRQAELRTLAHADIDAFSLTLDDGPRRHLGASEIGHKCQRYLWLKFRWMFYARFEPRMLRLFNRGHREEAWLWAMLRWAGWEVLEVDPTTGEQWRVSACSGHMGGSLDAVVKPPARYKIDEWCLAECKTNKDGDSSVKWNQLGKEGIKQNKPMHWWQSCTYGALKGISTLFYFVVNKDDDRYHIEVLPLDHTLGATAVSKGEFIILSQTSPPKLHTNPSMFDCKYCDARNVCHFGAAVLKNCRSCQHASPRENKTWHCAGYNAIIPDEVIAKGCDNWTALNV